MRDFEYYNPTRILFGKNSENELLYELRKYGKRVLLVYGGGSIKKSGLYEIVTQQIREANSVCFDCGGVTPNPKLEFVMKAIEFGKKNQVDFVLAVGGGSAIDAAKAIAAGILFQGNFADVFESMAAIQKALPVGVVLTIPASGSESSNGAVVTITEKGIKRSIKGECLIPRFAIMNPERCYTLPKYQTACGCCDIMAHLLERYFTTTEGVEFTDGLIESTLRTVIKFGEKCLDNPTDYNARAQVMWCGTIAHNNLLSTGRNGDWASHKLGHALSAFNDLAHGASLAIMFPAWMKYTYETDKKRFVALANNVFGIETGDKLEEQVIYEMITALQTLFKSWELPVSLREVGIEASNIPTIASKTIISSDHIGEFKPLFLKDIEGIFNLAL